MMMLMKLMSMMMVMLKMMITNLLSLFLPVVATTDAKLQFISSETILRQKLRAQCDVIVVLSHHHLHLHLNLITFLELSARQLLPTDNTQLPQCALSTVDCTITTVLTHNGTEWHGQKHQNCRYRYKYFRFGCQYCYFRLSVVVAITFFELAAVENPRVQLETNTFVVLVGLLKLVGAFYPKRNKCT